jgi:flagellar basal-body rod protein FlgG
MQAMETKLDVIANNLANVNTLGFKKDRANFEDLFYLHEKYPGGQEATGTATAVGKATGLGTRVASTQTEHTQGSFQDTGKDLDLAIEGNGFMQVLDANGETLYTRAGNLSRNANGQLVVGSAYSGRLIEPAITIPESAVQVTITRDGQVTVKEAGNDTLTVVGQLQLATFVNPAGLAKRGENLYSQTDASGQAQVLIPGQDGAGTFQQGMLEMSNVNPVHELIDLITTQRSFELNSQAIRTGDEMLQLITNLRR